jgi:hypothetical protein
MQIRNKNCFELHGRNDLSTKFQDKVKSGMSEKQAAREVILEDYKALHNDMEKLKKTVLGSKYKATTYTPEDVSEAVKKINDEYETELSNLKSEPTEPVDGGGVPPVEPPKGGGVHVERPATELSFKGLQDLSNEFSLSDVESRERKSDLQLRQDARETIDEWATKGEYAKNVEKLIQNAENKGVLSDKERVILEQNLANIAQEGRAIKDKFGLLSPEYEAKLQEIKRLKDAGQITRQEAGAALRIPLGGSRPKDINDFLTDRMADAGVDKLTDKQKEDYSKEWDDLQKSKDEFNAYMDKREKEFAAKQTEAEFNKTKTSSQKTKKTHEDFVSERKSLKDELSAARKEHEDWLKEQGIQKSGFGSLTGKEAKIIAKIVKNYAEEGITKLAEVVEKVFEEVKAVIPNIEEGDIRDVIAGKYNEKKPTRNDLAAKMVSLKN